LRNVTVSFMFFSSFLSSSPLSARPTGTTPLLVTDFYKILYLKIFQIYVEEPGVSLKSEKSDRHFTRRPTYVYDDLMFIGPCIIVIVEE